MNRKLLPKNEDEGVRSLDNSHVAVPMKLSWHNLSYNVISEHSKQAMQDQKLTEKKYTKTILHSESGYVNHGEALFIMGPSGAGKTTMLNALCDRLGSKKNAKLSGEVVINDSFNVSQRNFGQYGAYVMQDDILFATFSCRECLYFSAKLRLGLSHEETEQRVDQIIQDLGLKKCQNTLVGNNLIRGMSGGEK